MTEPTADEAMRVLHRCLNDLLALWYSDRGEDWNITNDSYNALALSLRVDPNQPVTVAFADEVRRRAEERERDI